MSFPLYFPLFSSYFFIVGCSEMKIGFSVFYFKPIKCIRKYGRNRTFFRNVPKIEYDFFFLFYGNINFSFLLLCPHTHTHIHRNKMQHNVKKNWVSLASFVEYLKIVNLKKTKSKRDTWRYYCTIYNVIYCKWNIEYICHRIVDIYMCS